MDLIGKMRGLIAQLNEASDAYYNTGDTIMTDKEFDMLLDELKVLEEKSGVILSNSPTQNVGYEVRSELNEVRHNHPMLSLDKTKSVADIVKFFEQHDGIAMLKMDGLTCSLGYNEDLISAETRGNGEIGEDVLHNAKVVTNIPLRVACDDLIVDGEMIIDYSTFERINEPLPKDAKYKNPRNLASGSIRQLNSEIAKERGLRFIAWKVVSGMDDNDFCVRLFKLNELGFEVVPYLRVKKGSSEDEIQDIINSLVRAAEGKGFPIDGIVFSYSDIAYGESLGMTSKFPRHSIAFKFKDDVYETTLREIEWGIGKTGSLCPVAIFDPVDIEGSTVTRASVHNVSILTELDLCQGDTITVYKANMIIPQIAENLSAIERSKQAGIGQMEYVGIPATCPICGGATEIRKDNDTLVLLCTNEYCRGKLLGKLSHAVSKNALNIEGMSESTLEFLIEMGWVNELRDLFRLERYNVAWTCHPGFGKKSVMKLFDQLEEKRNTTLERFLYAQSIPLIGRTASKQISRFCNESIEEFCKIMSDGDAKMFLMIDGFGDAMCDSLINWMDNHWIEFLELKQEFKFITETRQNKNDGVKDLSGKTFVITGKLVHFENRDELKEKLESMGAKVSGSVSKNTFALVCNEDAGSSKSKKAKELGVQVWTEEELIKYISE